MIGRPPKFESEAELSQAAEGFFKLCIENEKVPTKAGICLAFGIDKITYLRWKEPQHKFSAAIKEIDLMIEEAWVQLLIKNRGVGPIFYLKNAFKEDYRDSHDFSSLGQPIVAPLLAKLKPNVVQHNDSDKENIPDDSENQGDPGRNISR